MKKTKQITISAVVLSIVALVLLVFRILGEESEQDGRDPMEYVRLSVMTPDGNEEKIKLWSGENYTLFFFLPSYAEPDSCWICNDSQRDVYIDYEQLNERTPLSETDLDTIHSFSVGDDCWDLVFMRSFGIGTIYIDTDSGNMDYLSQDKNNREGGFMTLVNEAGKTEYRNRLSWISGRGNNSWVMTKKPWTIKLDKPQSLLGMDRSEKWVLLANAYDDSVGLRNYIVYKMAIELGLEYSSDLRFVDLYLNGQYHGLYQLAEKIDISRLDIGDLNAENRAINPILYASDTFETSEEYSPDGSYRFWADMTSPADISGGYILERNYAEKLAGRYYFYTSSGEIFVSRSPSPISIEESEYISSIMQSVEDALFSSDSKDSGTGKKLEDLIDIDSWIMKYLVEEVSLNEGAGSTSSYFYKKQGDDRIYAGPAWDYDKSLGRYSIWIDPVGLSYCSWHFSPSEWWKAFYWSDGIEEQIISRYEETFRPYLLELINSRVSEYADLISDSFRMEWVRWKNEHSSCNYLAEDIVSHPGEISHSVDYLLNWLKRRVDFLDETWCGKVRYCSITYWDSEGTFKRVTKPYGTVLTADEISAICPDGRPLLTEYGNEFDLSSPMTQDIRLYADVAD